MRTIHKYPLIPQDIVRIFLPVESEVLGVIEQYHQIVLYAVVETSSSPEPRYFYVALTGDNLPPGCEKANFVGTVQDDEFVFHVFDYTEANNTLMDAAATPYSLTNSTK